jgi:hypothetical protein
MGLVTQTWEILCIMIQNDHVGSVKSVHLMSEHERAFSISIISDYESLSLLRVIPLPLKHLTAHHQFEDLRGLTSRRSAHIKHGMFCFNAQKKGR